MTDDLLRRLEELLDRTAALLGDDAVATLRVRVRGPLRLAVAGRLKAGKSTLVNALLGERLAPTDAGECTTIVTWYELGPRYEAFADRGGGELERLSHQRDERGLAVDLGGRRAAEVERLVIRCPVPALRQVTIIDTPGLASASPGVSAATDALLRPHDGGPSQADAVLYLMRYLHLDDTTVLETFTDRSVAHASPVSAIGVLARADELGAGRLDAMATARRIAARYAADDRVRSLCGAVVPVDGLLAGAAVRLTEDDVAALRALAAEPMAELDAALVSVDRFREPGRTRVAPEVRVDLLDRFGLYGLRRSLVALLRGEADGAVALADLLLADSGLPHLRELVDRHVYPRTRALQARAVLAGVRAVAQQRAEDAPDVARAVLADVERVEAAAHELAELRLAHLVLSGLLHLRDDERDEIVRATSSVEAAARLGLAPTASVAAVAEAALLAIGRWRAAAERGGIDHGASEAADVMVRIFEEVYARSIATSP